MNFKKRSNAAAILVFLLLTGCGDRKNPVGPLPPLSVSEFPMEVGTEWLYAVQDDPRGLVDTVLVRIDSLTDTSNGRRTTLWTHHSRRNLITWHDVYVTQVADTVDLSLGGPGSPWLRFVFPLEPGKEWKYLGGWGGYLSIVEGETGLHTPSGYYRAFLVHTELSRINPGDLVDDYQLWIAPGVGIVRRERAAGRITVGSIEVWQLLGYSLPAKTGR